MREGENGGLGKTRGAAVAIETKGRRKQRDDSISILRSMKRRLYSQLEVARYQKKRIDKKGGGITEGSIRTQEEIKEDQRIFAFMI